MVYNFEFLEKDFPVLASFGGLAEKYCYKFMLNEIGNDWRDYRKSYVHI